MSPLVKGGEENGGGPGDVAGGGFVEKDEVPESGERLVSPRRKAGRGAVQNGGSFAMKKRGGREWETYLEEIRAGKRRILRSDVARLRAEAEATRKRFGEEGGAGADLDGDCFEISFRNGSDWIKVGEVVNAEKKKILCSDVAEQTEDSDGLMENAMEEALLNDDQLRYRASISKRGEGEGIEAEKKRLVNSCVVEQTKEANADEQKTAEESDTSEMKAIEVAEAGRKKITEECDSDIKKVTEEVGSDERELTKEADTSMKEAMGDVASGAFEYGSSCAIIERNDRDLIKCGDEKEVEVSRTMGLDAANRREEADAGGQETVDCRAPEADLNLNNSINKSNRTKGINCEEFKVDKKRITSLDITKKREEGKPDRKEVGEETDANLKKVIEGNDMSKKEATEETASGADHHGKNATIIRRIYTEQTKCSGKIEVEKKRIMKGDVANWRGEVDAIGKEVTEAAASGVQHNRKRSVTSKSNALDLVKSEQENKIEKIVTRSAAAKQRKEVDADKRKVKEEAVADNNKATEEFVRGADQNGNISTICKRIGKEQIKCEEEINIENKQIVGIDVAKLSEEVSTDKKKVKTEAGSRTDAEDVKQLKHVETKVENKWPMGLNFANLGTETDTHKKKVFTIKEMNDPEQIDFDETEVKNKTSVKSDDEKQNEEVDAIKKKIVKSELDRKRGREASDSKISWKKSKTESSKCGHDRTEKCGGKNLNIDSSNSQGLTPKSPVPANGQKDHLEGKTEQRSITGQGRGARNKKMDGFEEAHIPREGEENKKNGGFHKGSQSISKRLILSVKKTLLRKSCGARMGPKSFSPKVEPRNVKSSNGKSKVMVKREYSSTHLRKKNKVTASEGQKEAKEKVREQIKNMLLSAGWRIDLRPRKGKNYEDSVYISPRGSGYWSITKAYEVFQNEFDHACSEKGKNVSRNSSKSFKRSICNHEGRGFPFSAIPMEDLNTLKRKNAKRRSKEEHKKSKKKTGDVSRSKKPKGAGNAKHLKCKYDGGETKGKVKENGTAGSSSKGTACHELKKLHSGRYRNRQGGCALLVRGSNQEGEAGTVGYVPYVWKRTILSWMIDLGIVSSNGKVNYMNQKRTEAMLEGWITRDGVKCSCCSKILAVSMFEIHAGSKLCQPYQNIFVEETGVSLFQCLLDAWKRHDDSERHSFYTVDDDGDDPNDDTCGICGDGGDLICCDSCPSTFHLNCLGIQMLPPGDWHCTNCSCRYCVVSSCSDAQENGGTVPLLVTCSLCEEKYHQICTAKVDDVSVSSSLSCGPFCGHSCRELFEQLQRLLGVKNDLESGFSWTLLRCFNEDSPERVCGLDLRAECNSKIAVALAVMDECFLPIVDRRSGINLIHNVIYNCGSNFNRLNFHGFYTFILEHGDEIISAASLRFHGTRLAEMPFIGTRNMYRRQGMCRRLLGGIESALCSLNIEKLIIPAISELTETWTNVFGFKPLEVSQRQEIKSVNMLVFPGTGLLQKPLLREDSTGQSKAAEQVPTVKTG